MSVGKRRDPKIELEDTPMFRGQGEKRERAEETWKESGEKHKAGRCAGSKGRRNFQQE